MKRYNLRRSLFTYCVFICTVLILCSALTFILFRNSCYDQRSLKDIKSAKVNVNEALNYVEIHFDDLKEPSAKASLIQILEKNNIAAALLSLDGRVLFSSDNSSFNLSNEPINLKYVNIEDKEFFNYISPIVADNKIIANCIFSIPQSSLFSKPSYSVFIPLAAGLLISFITIIYIFTSVKKHILIPVKQLNSFSSSISKGILNNKFTFNTASEITDLFSSFQLMQDELKYSLEKQLNMEKEHKEAIACISHDLRTPLSSIKAYAGAIKDGFAQNKSDLIDFSNIIENKADSMSKLIDDFFEHSKAELGRLVINKHVLYSKEIIQSIYESHSFEFKKHGLSFILDENIPDVLLNADPLRLEQVLFNLFENARKYTPAGGTIKFGAYVENAFIKFYVKDSGIGISDFDLPNIFEKFFRGNTQHINGSTEGTGLGLAICKHIVESHGGEIFAESKVNNGSVFYFTIPKA